MTSVASRSPIASVPVSASHPPGGLGFIDSASVCSSSSSSSASYSVSLDFNLSLSADSGLSSTIRYTREFPFGTGSPEFVDSLLGEFYPPFIQKRFNRSNIALYRDNQGIGTRKLLSDKLLGHPCFLSDVSEFSSDSRSPTVLPSLSLELTVPIVIFVPSGWRFDGCDDLHTATNILYIPFGLPVSSAFPLDPAAIIEKLFDELHMTALARKIEIKGEFSLIDDVKTLPWKSFNRYEESMEVVQDRELMPWQQNVEKLRSSIISGEKRTVLDAIMGADPAARDPAIFLRVDYQPPPPAAYTQLFVKTLTGKTITIPTSLDLAVGAFKKLVQHKEGVPYQSQRLIYCGKQMENEHTLAYYQIQHESTLHLVLRLGGGMFHFTSGRVGFKDLDKESISTTAQLRELGLPWPNESDATFDLKKFSSAFVALTQEKREEAKRLISSVIQERKKKHAASAACTPEIAYILSLIGVRWEDIQGNTVEQKPRDAAMKELMKAVEDAAKAGLIQDNGISKKSGDTTSDGEPNQPAYQEATPTIDLDKEEDVVKVSLKRTAIDPEVTPETTAPIETTLSSKRFRTEPRE